MWLDLLLEEMKKSSGEGNRRATPAWDTQASGQVEEERLRLKAAICLVLHESFLCFDFLFPRCFLRLKERSAIFTKERNFATHLFSLCIERNLLVEE